MTTDSETQAELAQSVGDDTTEAACEPTNAFDPRQIVVERQQDSDSPDETPSARKELASAPGDDGAGTEAIDNDEDLTERCAADESAEPSVGKSWSRRVAHGLLPALAMTLAVGAGYLRWEVSCMQDGRLAADQTVRVATDGAVALLSYQPDTVERDLGRARDRLTGQFRDAYTSLTHDVVIPGAKQKHISAVATVPAAASVSATTDHAVVLVFINQTVTVGDDAPTNTASTVKVTLDRVSGSWLISEFEPV